MRADPQFSRGRVGNQLDSPKASLQIVEYRDAAIHERSPALRQLHALGVAIEQARALRRLFGGARPLDAVDLDLPERATAGTLDLAGLEARVTEAETALSDLRDAAEAELKKPATTADALRTLLLAAPAP